MMLFCLRANKVYTVDCRCTMSKSACGTHVAEKEVAQAASQCCARLQGWLEHTQRHSTLRLTPKQRNILSASHVSHPPLLWPRAAV